MSAESQIVRQRGPLCDAQSSCPQRVALCVEQRRMSAENSHSVHCPAHIGHVRQRGRLSAAQREGRAAQEATG